MSFEAAQRTQYRAMQQLVDEILAVQDSYRVYLLASTCAALQTHVEQDLAKRSMLLHEPHFAVTENACSKVELDGSGIRKLITGMQQAMVDAVDRSNAVSDRVHANVQRVEAHIRESATTEWRRALADIAKKTKSLHAKRVSQAQAKVRAIESSYSTDDLLVMQQMLHRL